MNKMYKLIRVNDGKIVYSNQVNYVEFNEDGTSNTVHPNIALGRSCLMGPKNKFYAWLTSEITEIISEVHFKTLNSEYKIEIIQEENE